MATLVLGHHTGSVTASELQGTGPADRTSPWALLCGPCILDFIEFLNVPKYYFFSDLLPFENTNTILGRGL